MTKNRDELLARIRRGEASKTSIEERQELERQLHTTKSALFQQRKKSRLQLEDIEEVGLLFVYIPFDLHCF